MDAETLRVVTEQNPVIMHPEEVFEEFPKIARLSRQCVVTEKLDGTNGQISITPGGVVRAGSRNRWVTPESDNYGFARWVKENEEQLRVLLGPGRHYGEWWGAGIGRKYDMKTKVFSLFNALRWREHQKSLSAALPSLSVVPVLWEGPFDTRKIEEVVAALRDLGSQAAPGFKRPEGIIVYHLAGKYLFKKTLEKDEQPKGQVSES